VRNAIREARQLGLVHVEERRVSAWRNLPNRLTITSREWCSWLSMRRRGVGANSCSPRIQESKNDASKRRNRVGAAEGQGTGREAPRRESWAARKVWC
jgi:hypothetical protein